MHIEIDDHSEFDQERLFLCQLITNTDLLKEVFNQFDPDLLSSEYSRIIGKWIQQHFFRNESAGSDSYQVEVVPEYSYLYANSIFVLQKEAFLLK